VILLDSDVLIEFLRGREPATTTISNAADEGEELATTALNIGEVLRGEQNATARDAATAFLASLTELPVDARVAHEFARLMQELDREGRRMPVIDGFIAATALVNGASILTRNAMHFTRVRTLVVRDV
jgi:predicted nucleic acid-binding protein